MTFAADCLSHTGLGGVPLLVLASLAIVIVGGVALTLRKSWLAKTTLLLTPLLLIAGLTLGTPVPAHAEGADECGISTPAPAAAVVAPVITNATLDIYAGYPGGEHIPFRLQIAATGDGPLTFAFVDPAAAAAILLAIDPATGLISETGGLLSACIAVTSPPFTDGATLELSVTNAGGTDIKAFRFDCDH
jgi:hypothetical protein